MKKFLALMFVFATMPMMASNLELLVADGSPGYVDNKTVDVATMAEGDFMELELWLRDLDFTFAGFEGEFTYPTWLYIVDTTTVGEANAPYDTALAASQKLPANASGEDTAVTFRNDKGYARVGAVVTDPAQRPTSGDLLLATFRIKAGRDFSATPAARALATCITATETIEFLSCNTGATNCQIMANDAAENVSVTANSADLFITVNNSDTTFVKGDANNNGVLTTQDVGKAIQCIVFGNSGTNVNCPIDGTEPRWTTILDVNCSGTVTTQDIGPLIRRAIGTNNRPVSKNLVFSALDAEGAYEVAGGSKANVVGVALKADGKVSFGQPQISQQGIADGWQIAGNHILSQNVYKYVLYNLKGKDLIVPDVNVPYTAKGEAKVALSDMEVVSSKGTEISGSRERAENDSEK